MYKKGAVGIGEGGKGKCVMVKEKNNELRFCKRGDGEGRDAHRESTDNTWWQCDNEGKWN